MLASSERRLSWDVRVALAFFDAGKPIVGLPTHIVMSVQMLRQAGGCVANAHARRVSGV